MCAAYWFVGTRPKDGHQVDCTDRRWQNVLHRLHVRKELGGGQIVDDRNPDHTHADQKQHAHPDHRPFRCVWCVKFSIKLSHYFSVEAKTSPTRSFLQANHAGTCQRWAAPCRKRFCGCASKCPWWRWWNSNWKWKWANSWGRLTSLPASNQLDLLTNNNFSFKWFNKLIKDFDGMLPAGISLMTSSA